MHASIDLLDLNGGRSFFLEPGRVFTGSCALADKTPWHEVAQNGCWWPRGCVGELVNTEWTKDPARRTSDACATTPSA
jgi:hypothetical protein